MRIVIKTTEREKNILDIALCTIRVIVMLPLIFVGFIYAFVLWVLGTKRVMEKSTNYWNGIAFNYEEDTIDIKS